MIPILTSLNIAGLVLALFFISLLLAKKDKQLRDYLLAFFILLLGSFLLIKYVFQYDLYKSYPVIVYIDICYWVLLGPALYVYTLVSTRGENRLRLTYLYTLIPFVLVVICFSRYILGTVTDLFDQDTSITIIAEIGFYIWLYNSPVFYILTILAIRKHQKNIKNQFSYTKSIDLKWLNYLTHGFAVFILFIIIRGPVRYFFGWEFPFGNYGISLWVVFLYIFGIGFYGYKQQGIFDNYIVSDAQQNDQIQTMSIVMHNEKNNLSYQKSGLNRDKAHLILDKLKSLMFVEQPYLDSELDLPTLAQKVNVSTHRLSQAINEYLGKNFFDFVNEYRIEKVKEYLANSTYNHLKIVSLAYDSGFSSKSTFYTLFKKSEGITPAAYRQQAQHKAS